jgi:hypothetical protein
MAAGMTRRKYVKNIQNPYQEGLNPAFAVGLWADCPLEAIRADPSLGYIFYEDFTNWRTATPTSTTMTGWTGNAATSGSVTIPDSAGGWLNLISAETAARGMQVQKNHEIFFPAVDKPIWFEARIRLLVTLVAEVFVGLSNNDTSILSGSANTSTDHIGWQSVTDDGVLLFTTENAGTGNTEAASTLVVGTAIRLGFKVENATSSTMVVNQYINDVKQAAGGVNANVSVMELKPSLVCQSGGTGVPVLHVDYVKCVQLGRR